MTAYDSHPATRSLRRPLVSDLDPAEVEKSALMTWCAPQSAGSIAVDTPAACACRIKYTSLEFANEKSEMAVRAIQKRSAGVPPAGAAGPPRPTRLSSP